MYYAARYELVLQIEQNVVVLVTLEKIEFVSGHSTIIAGCFPCIFVALVCIQITDIFRGCVWQSFTNFSIKLEK